MLPLLAAFHRVAFNLIIFVAKRAHHSKFPQHVQHVAVHKFYVCLYVHKLRAVLCIVSVYSAHSTDLFLRIIKLDLLECDFAFLWTVFGPVEHNKWSRCHCHPSRPFYAYLLASFNWKTQKHRGKIGQTARKEGEKEKLAIFDITSRMISHTTYLLTGECREL